MLLDKALVFYYAAANRLLPQAKLSSGPKGLAASRFAGQADDDEAAGADDAEQAAAEGEPDSSSAALASVRASASPA